MYIDKAEGLRAKMKELMSDLEKTTVEKGLAAEENKDLRENSAYDYWDEKERNLIFRIRKIMRDISDTAKKEKSTIKTKRTKKTTEKLPFDIRPHKWL